MKLLGIDNVFFEVPDLEKALSFYEKLGFKKKVSIPQLKAILFSIGEEEPGLIICQKKTFPLKIMGRGGKCRGNKNTLPFLGNFRKRHSDDYRDDI